MNWRKDSNSIFNGANMRFDKYLHDDINYRNRFSENWIANEIKQRANLQNWGSINIKQDQISGASEENMEATSSPKSKTVNCECENCHFTTTDLWIYQKHIDECNRSGEQIESGASDIETQHNNRTVIGDTTDKKTCKVCNKTFKFTGNLERHMLMHSGEKPFKCNICDMTFPFHASLKYHSKIHKTKKFKCQFCQKGFTQARSLKRHMAKHSDDKPFKCDLCEKSYADALGLRRHMFTHTGEKAFNCSLCGKSFSVATTFKDHMKSHMGERPACEICHKTFASESNLAAHGKIHMGTKPTCKICGKMLSSHAVLKVHLKLHTAPDKTFNCGICAKNFRKAHTLNKHIISHTKQTPFTCKSCDMTFAYYKNLKSHLKIRCQVCGKIFVCNTALETHLKIHSDVKLSE